MTKSPKSDRPSVGDRGIDKRGLDDYYFRSPYPEPPPPPLLPIKSTLKPPRIPISPLLQEGDLILKPGESLQVRTDSFVELGMQNPEPGVWGFTRYEIYKGKVLTRHYIQYHYRPKTVIESRPPAQPEPPLPPPPPLCPITPEHRGLGKKKKKKKKEGKKTGLPEGRGDAKTDAAEAVPEAGPDWGTGVGLVSTILDGVSAFGGSMLLGGLAVLGAWVGAFFSFRDAARAGDATKRMSELLGVAFATTAWMFNHPKPKIPSEFSDRLGGRAWVDVQRGWKAVDQHQIVMEKWFDQQYDIIKQEARKRKLAIPTRSQVRQEIPRRIKLTPQQYARRLLTSRELTGLLLPGELNAKPSMWRDFFAKIPYKVRAD